MWSKLAKNDRDLSHITVDFVFNGAVGLVVFFIFKYAFLVFTPTTWYFEYTSVEPFSVPAFISDEYIEMQSTLQVDQAGELDWNDVLRCLSSDSNRFDYVGEYNTRSATVAETDGVVVSRWRYRGEMPTEPAYCRIDSTITRHLPYGIEKQQFIQSSVFKVEL
jgi:hypothetical protein